LRFDDIDPLEALDYVSFQTRTFWKVVDTRNIVILPDTPEVHAELDPQVTKIYNLVNATAANTASIINAIRTAFSVRQIEQRSVGSIAIVDTPQRIALWEQVIASLDKVR
jgi:hypothetical protein